MIEGEEGEATLGIEAGEKKTEYLGDHHPIKRGTRLHTHKTKMTSKHLFPNHHETLSKLDTI